MAFPDPLRWLPAVDKLSPALPTPPTRAPGLAATAGQWADDSSSTGVAGVTFCQAWEPS